MYRNIIKRVLDIVLSLTGLIVLFIPLIFISLQIRKKLGSPVIFKQKRPGKHGKVFELYKFRSMTDDKDENGVLLPDNLRLNEFGKKLRASSIDELPELYNILMGDMSVVGPRPLLVEYLQLYNDEQARRHDVKPGLTGWAQINGRNGISWEEKFKLDVWYVDNLSFLLDLKIFFLTVKKVFIKEGINASDDVTMEKFKGSRD